MIAKRIGLSISIGIIFICYLFLATYGTFKFEFTNVQALDDSYHISYGHLADALSEGKVSLLIKPHLAFKSLKNPYTATENKPYRWEDASYYKGNYYLYWGIVPVILFHLPYKLLTNKHIADNLVAFIFVFIGFLFSLKLLNHLQVLYFKNISTTILIISYLLLGFCNLGPYLLRHSDIYHISTEGAFCFIMGALYFLIKNINTSAPKIKEILITSLFFGLAVGCRPSLIIITVVLITYFLVNHAKLNNKSLCSILKEKNLYTISAPFLFILTLLLLYNYLRFENIFEFGLKYQLNMLSLGNGESLFSPKFIVTNIFFHFFQPLKFHLEFPFVYINFYANNWLGSTKSHIFTFTAGLFYIFPFVFLYIYQFFVKPNNNKSLLTKEYDLLTLCFLINLMLILCTGHATIRYMLDYLPFLLILTIITWFHLISTINKSFVIKSIGIILALYSCMIGMSLGFAHTISGIENKNPQLYIKLKSFFK